MDRVSRLGTPKLCFKRDLLITFWMNCKPIQQQWWSGSLYRLDELDNFYLVLFGYVTNAVLILIPIFNENHHMLLYEENIYIYIYIYIYMSICSNYVGFFSIKPKIEISVAFGSSFRFFFSYLFFFYFLSYKSYTKTGLIKF